MGHQQVSGVMQESYNRCGKWAPANNMKYIVYASFKISDRTGSADFMIFNFFFSAEAGPGHRIHCPGFAAEAEE